MQLIDNKAVGNRLSEIMRASRVKSSRAFALSVGADPSFFAKIMKGERPLTDLIADAVSKKYGVSLEWVLSGTGEMKLEKAHSSVPSLAEPSPMQILATLAEAFKDQARAFAAQADVLKSIENKMAQENTQARIDTNLKKVFAGIETIGEIQGQAIKKILADLAEIKGGKKGPS